MPQAQVSVDESTINANFGVPVSFEWYKSYNDSTVAVLYRAESTSTMEKSGTTNIQTEIPVPENSNNNDTSWQTMHDWLFLAIVFGFAFLAFIKTIFPDYIRKYFVAVYSKHMSNILQREINPTSQQAAFLLNLAYTYSFSILLFELFLVFDIYTPINNSLLLWLTLWAGVLIFFICKFFIIRFISVVFSLSEMGGTYLHNYLVFTKVAGLVILPFALIIPYIPLGFEKIMAYCAVFIVSLLYFFRNFNGIQIIIRKQFSIFYLILYLCTLEFLPLWLLFNYLIKG